MLPKVISFDRLDPRFVGVLGQPPIELQNLKEAGFYLPKSFFISGSLFLDVLEVTTSSNSIDIEELARLSKEEIKQLVVIPEYYKHEILKHYGEISGFTETPVNLALYTVHANDPFDSEILYYRSKVKGDIGLLNAISDIISEFTSSRRDLLHSVLKGHLLAPFYIFKNPVPESSGLLYWNANNRGVVNIEANFGLYRASKEAGVDCDQYTANLDTVEIKDRVVCKQEFLIIDSTSENSGKVKISSIWQNKQKLDDKNIKHLVELFKNYYLRTQDIIDQYGINEIFLYWNFEAGKLYLEWINLKPDNKNIKQLFSDRGNDDSAAAKSELKYEGFEEEIQATQEEEVDELFNDYSLLAQGSYYVGGIAKGEICLDPKLASENSILVLRGDEEIPANLKIKGFIIEEESDALAETLNQIFHVPAVTGVNLARKIFKDGEDVIVDCRDGKIYVKSLIGYNGFAEQINSSNDESSGFVKLNGNGKEVVTPKHDETALPKNEVANSGPKYTETVMRVPADLYSRKYGQNERTEEKNDEVLYINDKLKIERKRPPLGKLLEGDRAGKTNRGSLEISKLLDLINEDYELYKVQDGQDTIEAAPVGVVELPKQTIDVPRHLENLINYSKELPSYNAVEMLDEISGEQDSIKASKELEFDKEEKFVQGKVLEIEKSEGDKANAPDEVYIPTVTKVYINLVDDLIGDHKKNYDGLVFTSTQELDVAFDLLTNNLSKVADKQVLAVCPPYENPVLEKFILEISKVRKSGFRNLSLVLPDYRNRKEIVSYKNMLSRYGLKRSSTFEIYANVSRGINVFRLKEIDDNLVDGIYIDLFRLKINLLGAEKYTASTRYVEGMRSLMEYISKNTGRDVKVIVNVSGFSGKRKILNHLVQLDNITAVSCEIGVANNVKRHLQHLENKKLVYLRKGDPVNFI